MEGKTTVLQIQGRFKPFATFPEVAAGILQHLYSIPSNTQAFSHVALR